MLRRRTHLGGTEGLAAARRGARQARDAADYGFCAMGRASGSARDDSAGFVPIEGRVHGYGRDPYFHIDRASGGFHLTPAVRETVPPVSSRAPPVAIETGQIGNFSARVDTTAHIQQRGLIQSIQLGLRRARSS